MENFTITVKPQYVGITDEQEIINGENCKLHEIQKRIKLDYHSLPSFVIITAPTGTGKSYAFPFPVLNAKKSSKTFDEDSVRGLIVLPTNALIDELTESFKKTYRELEISKLTGKELDQLEVKSFKRWTKAIELARKADLLITNPDIINYAMHGGYHQSGEYKKGGDVEFRAFLDKFHYIIFDEYHLYDEAQIANILTLVKLKELYWGEDRKDIKFFFVSATPESGLKTILEQEGYVYEEIQEIITDQPHQARAIHGALETNFVLTDDMKELILSKTDEIRHELENNRKVLIILDNLRQVQELSEQMQSMFPQHVVYQSTGYVAKNDNHNEQISKANIILATNKAEVGVNYHVEYCIMQPGKFFQNFVQRFGRVARGDKSGKIIIALLKNADYNKLERLFTGQTALDYYSFLDTVRKVLQNKSFYTELIPFYWGEYLWCIVNNIRKYQEYNTFKYIERRLDENQTLTGKVAYRYYLFAGIDRIIRQMLQEATDKEVTKGYRFKNYEYLQKKSPTVYAWLQWWKNYTQTYLTFRDASKTVMIIDNYLNTELEYSLDWILQHRDILKKETVKTDPFTIEKYYVGSFKLQDKDLQYTVSTIPNVRAKENDYLSYKDKFNLQTVWSKAIDRIYDKISKGDTTETLTRLQLELLAKLYELKNTFTLKRLKIEDIANDNPYL